MEAFELLILSIAMMLNGVMLAYLGLFIFAFIRYEKVRDNVIEAFQNGDKISHTQDAFKAVTLGFAVVFGWADLDMFLVWAYSGKDFLVPTSGLTLIFGGLLGVSFKSDPKPLP